MASILDLLNTQNGEHFVAKASEQTQENKAQITGVLAMGLPILLGALKKNIGSKDGEQKLDQALNSEKHGEDLLVDMESKNASEMVNHGEKILDHILGPNKENIVSTISATLGMKDSSVGDILRMAAPLVMSILASQKRKEELDASALGDLLDSVMGSSEKFDPSLIETLLAGKGDANIIKDVKSIILGGGNKGKKDGGLLGGMVGGK